MALALRQRPELAQLAATRAQNDVDQRILRGPGEAAGEPRRRLYAVGLSGGTVTRRHHHRREHPDTAVIRDRLNELLVLAGLTTVPIPPTPVTVPDFFVGGYPTSLDNLFARRFPTAVVQMQIQLPIVNSTARANIARAELVSDPDHPAAPAAGTGYRGRRAQRAAVGADLGGAAERRPLRPGATRRSSTKASAAGSTPA